MNKTLIRNIVDMARWVATEGYFSQLYEFDNGTALSVSRNPYTPGSATGLVSVLPYDKDGKQVDERAENWLTALEVAEKMEVLAAE